MGIRIFIYPMNLIKTRQMTASLGSKPVSIFQVSKNLFKVEGPLGFYKGFLVNSLGIISGQVYGTTFEYVRQQLLNATENSPHFYSDTFRSLFCIISGALSASLLAQTIAVPLDIISQKQMVGTDRILPSRFVIKDIYQTSGFSGFYRGFSASLFTYLPTSSLFWAFYISIKSSLSSNFIDWKKSQDEMPFAFMVHNTNALPEKLLIQSVSGVFAGSIAGFLTNPIDLLRTRIQTSPEFQNMSPIQGFRAIFSSEGFFGFWRGALSRVLAVGPPAGIIISGYELIKYLSLKDSPTNSQP